MRAALVLAAIPFACARLQRLRDTSPAPAVATSVLQGASAGVVQLDTLPVGSFVTFTTPDPNTVAVWAGDVNQDGREDVAVFLPRSNVPMSLLFGYARGGSGAATPSNFTGLNGFALSVTSLLGGFANVGRIGNINGNRGNLADTMIRSVNPVAGANAFILWGISGRVFNASEVADSFRLPDASLLLLNRGSSASSMTVSLGDVNGDRVDDVALQTAGVNDGLPPVVTVLFGSSASNAWPYTIDLTSVTPPRGVTLNFGLGVQLSANIGSGDVNGDGLGDILVSRSGNGLPGIVCVVYGQSNGNSWPAAGLNLPSAIFASPQVGFVMLSSVSSTLGGAVTSGGDFNCDGHQDILVSDTGIDAGAGRIYIVFGTPGGFNVSVDVAMLTAAEGLSFSPLDAANTSNSFNRFVSSATFIGDFNKDGCDDVLVRGDAAEVYLIMGTATPPAALRSKDSTPVLYRDDLQGDAGYVIVPGLGEFTFTSPPVDDAKHSDFDGDGVADVLLSVSNGTTYVLYGGYVPAPSASASVSASMTPSTSASASITPSVSVTSSPGSSASSTPSASWTNASMSSTPAPAGPSSWWTWGIPEIAGLASGGGVLLALIVVVFACCCRGKQASDNGPSIYGGSLQSSAGSSRMTRTQSRHMIAESDDAAGVIYSSYAALADDAPLNGRRA